MTQPLYRLSTGAWIDLALVTGIVPCEGFVARSGEKHPPFVRVNWGESDVQTLEFKEFVAAQSCADKLAALVNAARGEGKSP